MRTCQTCGARFEPRWPRQPNLYCSQGCWHRRGRKALRKCDHCGKQYPVYSSKGGLNGTKFCSRECKGIAGRNAQSLECKGCGKLYVAHPSSRRQYCSYDCFISTRQSTIQCVGCATEFKRLHKNSKYCTRACSVSHKLQKSFKTCIICGTVFQIWNKDSKCCSRKCGQAVRAHKLAGAMAGSRNPMWNPDREHVQTMRVLSSKVHHALRATLKAIGSSKNGKTSELLGYGYQELKARLESHSDWAELKQSRWTLDHIFPIRAFVDHGILDVKIINALDNLQPLTRKENSSKSAKYDTEQFMRWVESKGVSLTPSASPPR